MSGGSSAAAADTGTSAAARRAFPANWWARAGWIALALYVVYAVSLFDISWARFLTGLDNGARFVARMLPPNFARWEILVKGLAESIEIAVLASTLGIVASLPLGLLAARNLMPWWVTWPARLFIALCRSFHPVIVAIVFVKAIGFGALSGIAALAVASIGFTGKIVPERDHLRGAAAGGEPFHGLRHLPARLEPA